MEKLKLLSPPKYAAMHLSPKFLQCLGAFAAGMLLSGARLLGVHLPAAVCLTAALGATLPGVFSYLGAAAGCLLLWETETVLLTLAAGFLALAVAWALQDLPFAQKSWFAPMTALLPGLVVGLMLLLTVPLTAKTIVAFVLQTISLPLGVLAVRQILSRPTGTPICAALFALVSGSGGLLLPGKLPLGGILACGAVFSLTGTTLALPAAALAGLALDWSWQGNTSCVAVLTAASLAAAYIPAKKRWIHLTAYLLTAGLVLILSGGGGGELFFAAVLGAGISLLLPPIPVEEPALNPADAAKLHLRAAANALEEVYRQLEDMPQPDGNLEIADIYDKATSRICATCAGYNVCWKQDGAKTCQIFLAAAPTIFSRKSAKIEDFPPEFQTGCRHFPKLLQAITTTLEQDADRRQRQSQRRELRAVLGNQYRILSDFLRLNVLPLRGEKEPNFLPDAAVSIQSKRSGTVCGDRCSSFRVGERQFLLLCDGMGTGTEAAVSSRRAMTLLTGLLRAGMEPDSALETLGALAILREDGGSSTVDLAWVSLRTGEGVLYKWGGGPSYLKTAENTVKLGTATLPPGLGVGGTHQAQQIRLSLGRGEVLVLTSDGVDGEDAQRLISAANGLKAEDLAAGIVRSGANEGEDDRSAAVLTLHPASLR